MAAVAPAGRTGHVLAATGDARGLPTRTEPDRAGALRSAADQGDFVAAPPRTRQAPRRPPAPAAGAEPDPRAELRQAPGAQSRREPRAHPGRVAGRCPTNDLGERLKD
ncbi:hypothetical protein QFZ82_001164 [Streptomyces sp. V4I23]|nr:hypothetical protein [Streptomyces sp. V4I23]